MPNYLLFIDVYHVCLCVSSIHTPGVVNRASQLFKGHPYNMLNATTPGQIHPITPHCDSVQNIPITQQAQHQSQTSAPTSTAALPMPSQPTPAKISKVPLGVFNSIVAGYVTLCDDIYLDSEISTFFFPALNLKYNIKV